WLGTVEGLVRFDGVRFVVFDRQNTPQIGNSHVTALLEDHAGTLWIGTAGGGITRYGDGRFSLVTARDGLAEDYVTALAEDERGSVWAGTLGHGVSRWEDGKWTRFGAREGLPNEHVQTLAVDSAGALWIGLDGALAKIEHGKIAAFPLPAEAAGEAVVSLCVDRPGELWVGTTKGLRRFERDHFAAVDGLPAALQSGVTALSLDQAGKLWLGTSEGAVYQRTAGAFGVVATREDLPKAAVRSFFPDADGDLWIGTYGGGLVRLRHGRIGVYTTADGLSAESIRPILQDASGAIWVGTSGGLDRFDNGTFTEVTQARTNTLTTGPGQTLFIAPGVEKQGATRLADGQRVSLWPEREIPSVIALLCDRAGQLWIGTIKGLFTGPSDGSGALSLASATLQDAHVESLFQDRAGSIWIGTINDGLNRYADGRFTQWTTANGLPDNHILGFYEDRAGALWIGTHGGGLLRYKAGKFVTITSKDGLYDDLAFSILEDDAGMLWMSGNKGIYRASLAELNAFADGRATRVHSYGYGAADGMISRECNGASPAGGKMRDGTLWFPTIKGVAVVDAMKQNNAPPHVVLESAMVDRQPHSLGEKLTLHPGEEELEVQYTALSWQRPQEVRFEYQLAGLTRDWTSAGTRRTAYFSHLPPGSYTFQVRADNGDGVWSAVASLPIVMLPPFWQTWWFVSLGISLLCATIGLGFWWRGRQLQQRYAMQRDFSRRLIAAHETERRRVAAELHDGLGQTLAMLNNSALSATQNAPDLRSAKQQIEQITEHSAQAIGEVRDIAYNLRPYLLDRLGLTKALRSMLN
ncbi:MAG: histidine kinase, partial [Verrucomicrobiota bacterium]|nr:histidine kinase [Verrucomicrobiota bacterium]